MIPDIEKIAGAYLREWLAAVDELDASVVGQTPKSTAGAWVRLTLLNAPGNGVVDHLVAFLVQFDCYSSAAGADGSQQKEANLLARTVRAALTDLPGVHDGAVVTGVQIVGHLRLPDQDFEPARERVIVTATIHAHS